MGHVVLGTGKGDDMVQESLHDSGAHGHRNWDMLNLMLFTKGRELLSETRCRPMESSRSPRNSSHRTAFGKPDVRSAPRTRSTGLAMGTLLVASTALAAVPPVLLSKDAVYTIRSYGWCAPVQILDGTNYRVPKTPEVLDASGQYVENFLVQDTDASGDRLIDGLTDAQHAIFTWTWRHQPKMVDLVFDLGRKSRIEHVVAITLGNNVGERNLGDHVRDVSVFVSHTPPVRRRDDGAEQHRYSTPPPRPEDGWKPVGKIDNASLDLPLDERPPVYAFEARDLAVSGRYVMVRLSSYASKRMFIIEVEIHGTPLEPSRLGNERGLRRIDERPRPEALIRLPDTGPDSLLLTNNRGREGGTGLAVTYELASQHAGTEDTSAADSDPERTRLTDGDLATAVIAHDRNAPYVDKKATIIFDLAETFDIDRVVVHSAGHRRLDDVRPVGSFINWYSIAVSDTGQPGSWVVAEGEVRNPLWPREHPASGNYAIVSSRLEKTARFVRLDLVQFGHSGTRIEVGEVEVWGRRTTVRPVAATGGAAGVSLQAIAIEPEPLGRLRPVFERFRQGKFRFGYGASEIFYQDHENAVPVGKDPEPTDRLDIGEYKFSIIEQMAAAGFTGIMPKLFSVNATSPVRMKYRVQLLAEACGKYGLNLLVATCFGSDHCAVYRRYHDGAGEAAKTTPCPRDEQYWQQVVLDRILITARLSLDWPILGHVIDFEMYQSDTERYPGPCLCDTCLDDFLKEFLPDLHMRGIPARERKVWLDINGLGAVYKRFMERDVARITTRIERAVHEANPDLMLGYMPHFERIPGLTRGLGTPEQPVVILSELEYVEGFSPAMEERRARVAAEGYPALYCPGIFMTEHRFETLRAHFYRMAQGADGYWIYCMEILWSPEMTGPYALDEGKTRADYWGACRDANTAIAERRRQGPAYAPPFGMPADADK